MAECFPVKDVRVVRKMDPLPECFTVKDLCEIPCSTCGKTDIDIRVIRKDCFCCPCAAKRMDYLEEYLDRVGYSSEDDPCGPVSTYWKIQDDLNV